ERDLDERPGPPVEDPAGETERPGRLGFLRSFAIDLTPLRKSRDFRRLWIGNAVSLLGSMLTTVAIPYQMYQLTGSTLAVGLLAPMPPGEHVERPGFRAIAEGFRLVKQKPELQGIFAVDTIAMVFGMPSALFPAFAESFGGGARTVGFLYAAPYAGAFVSTLA